MKTLQWDKEISVNNHKIDQQHQRLFELTNNLIQNATATSRSKIVNEALSELLHYSRTHFTDEEAILAEHNYPKLAEHRAEHEAFKYQMAMFSKDVLYGKESVIEEMIDYLITWLAEHTSSADQDYKNYL